MWDGLVDIDKPGNERHKLIESSPLFNVALSCKVFFSRWQFFIGRPENTVTAKSRKSKKFLSKFTETRFKIYFFETKQKKFLLKNSNTAVIPSCRKAPGRALSFANFPIFKQKRIKLNKTYSAGWSS
jgi:hypothetical protein